MREREVQRRAQNEGRQRRGRVFPLLIKEGHLKDGDRLWLLEGALKSEHRHLYVDGDQRFSGTVRTSSPPKLLWQRDPDAEPEAISPASLTYEICQHLLGEPLEGFGTAVAENFTLGVGGPTLAAIANEHGLWTEASDAPGT